MLQKMRKKIPFARIERAMETLHAGGLSITGNLIFGHPGETYETALKTIEWWEAHPQYFSIALVFLFAPPSTNDGRISTG